MIVAIVVSYNDSSALSESIQCLAPMVDRVVVVDNGSKFDVDNTCSLPLFSNKLDIVKLSDNFGIGKALNVGLDVARKYSPKWILTMDQDSKPGVDMVRKFLAAHEMDSGILCMTPNINSNKSLRTVDMEPVIVPSAITSGNFISCALLDKVGQFNEDLFIDCVDFDYSLRIRALGYKIHRIFSAHMSHRLGDKKFDSAIFKFHTSHTPLRRYYMVRNSLYLWSKYKTVFPWFVYKLLFVQILGCLSAYLYGPKRVESLRMTIGGCFDYIHGVKGKYR